MWEFKNKQTAEIWVLNKTNSWNARAECKQTVEMVSLNVNKPLNDHN